MGLCVVYTVHVFKNDAVLRKPFPLLHRDCTANAAPECLNTAPKDANAIPEDANAALENINAAHGKW